MQKIIPFLWFDNNAEEAVNFYVSTFKNSRIGNETRYGEAGAEASARPKGSVMTIPFQLNEQAFIALNGGPMFKFTPAVSFFVTLETQQEIDGIWKKLSEEAVVLMELGQYPSSEKFGWLQDKFGISWQLSLADKKQQIIPFLMFVGDQHGRTVEAVKLYTSIFQNSKIAKIERYGVDEEEPEGTVKHATFSLNGQDFMAMDSNRAHQFTFTPAISFLVNCNTQEEIDHLWTKFTEDGQTEQCGWLKDKYGVSWQIVPTVLQELLQDNDKERTERVMRTLLKMVKLDIKTLIDAYEK